jgi:hypothetical protein
MGQFSMESSELPGSALLHPVLPCGAVPTPATILAAIDIAERGALKPGRPKAERGAASLVDSLNGRSRRKSLRVGDLRHLGRRRKAFERSGEHGVRFGKPVGRLVELAKGKRSF